ncbi:DUF2062 domain-containing protein [Rhodoferax sp.]|uniref:DUF2062 domain-containing protein n=1 Tax=Rhodoferax sp. TaxID=50421 RepID=UPI0027158A63|nr:DUF2062 domain-containing protein [Rhodoferax sp.]MDO9145802.1 DUF2062 domain-containing protein [Rhodoferax sp.]MDP1942873.1 DUF2062 domain-containing protein [Rhodoferax sp.]MDP3191558.1 DUF2062 domain-containing protein [Rhodoferax sp.]MDP3337358.1 DUF2062 domain-containing protein [Rhodoferax sp.]MDP3864677.1 DUF2062 domain-containing protein [Rhodoferax sp.]
MRLLQRLKSRLPSREQIARNRWLAWLGPWLHSPKLWHWSRRGVAMGVALGVFFGLLIPIAQIPLSVAAAIVMRANIPTAVASTLVTNPVTFGPIYYGAYRLGVWVTGSKEHPKNIDLNHPQSAVADKDASFWQRITNLGKPLLVGLALSAVMMGLLTYALISLIWRWRTVVKRRGRMRAPPS